MLVQPIRALRSPLARFARQQIISKRNLITPTAIRQSDVVQELYLRELKNYKTPPLKATDAEGQVLKFIPPKTRESPEETNIANELKEYEASTVEIEGQAGDGVAAASEQDWFVDDIEDDHTKAH